MVYRKLKLAGNMVTFRELQGCMEGVSDAYLRQLIIHPKYTGLLKKHIVTGKATLYELLGEI